MRASDVLRAIPFGQGIAENDNELENYFVKTPAFWEVVHNEADLILGTKGSGKTAISKIIGSAHARERTHISDLDDVLIRTAFSTGTSWIFSRLEDNVGENVLRRVWMAYLLGIAGNSVLDEGQAERAKIGDLERLMQGAGIRAKNASPPDQWHKLTADIISVAETGDVHNVATPPWAQPEFEFLPIARAVNECLIQRNERCWILLDRLDEAFSDRPELERTALRALLRTHLDLTSTGEQLRTKIFLRSDIFERVTHTQGFVNLDHFQVVNLNWRASDITKLLSQRILASGETAQQELRDAPEERVVDWCLPNPFTFFDGRRYAVKNSLNWCIEVSSSRKNEPSPRNLLKLLKEAQRHALTRMDDSEHKLGTPLLESEDLIHGWTMLSRARLEDTIYAETNHLRRYVDAFKHQPQRATRQTIVSRIAAVSGETRADQVIRDLESAGFLHSVHGDLFDIAPLYLPALEIEAGAPGARTASIIVHPQQDASPEVIRQQAKELSARDERAEAVNLLIKHSAITLENAILAANIAIELGDRPTLQRVDTLLERPEFATELIGKRIALKFAMGKNDSAQTIINQIASRSPEQIDEVFRNFVGGLTFNATLEHSVWIALLSDSQAGSSQNSTWAEWVPVVAASRFLAVARGLLGAQSFTDRTNELAREWFGAQRERAIREQTLTEFLERYIADFRSSPVAMFPYQIVSIVHVLDRLYSVAPEMRSLLVTEVARHVKVGAERYQRAFRDWSDLDPFAQDVVYATTNRPT